MSIRKRTWKSAGEDKTAWVIDYVDQNGKRRLKTFSLKKDAEAWATTALHEVAQGVHAPDSKVTVADIVDQWIDHGIAEGLERGTIEPRKKHLKLHIAPFIGRVKLAELTTPMGYTALPISSGTPVDRWRCGGRFSHLYRVPSRSPRGGDWWRRTQSLGSRCGADGRGKEKVVIPSKAELKLLIDKSPERWRPFIITAIFTGLRASELRGLRWADVDLRRGCSSRHSKGRCLEHNWAAEVSRRSGREVSSSTASDQHLEAVPSRLRAGFS